MDYRRKDEAYFTNTRRDIQGLLPARSSSDGRIRVLELGCGDGATLHWLKQSGYADETWGIELRDDMAQRAAEQVDRVWSGDALTRLAEIPSGSLQGILCLDVLEHLQDPWAVVDTLAEKLVPRGWIIASIPNLRRLPVLWNLGFRGRFEYADRGIMDRTHLRFFTRSTAVSLMHRKPMQVDLVTETPHAPRSFSAWWNRFTMGLARDLVAEQYLVRAVKSGGLGVLKSGTLGVIALIWMVLCGYTRPAQAQSMPVGTPYWEDALRRSQLMGELDSNISFMIRPVDPNLLAGATGVWGYDSLTDPIQPLRDLNFAKKFSLGRWNLPLKLQTMPLLMQSRFNEHHPYGWSDGPMVPAKGLQTYLSAGVYVRLGPLEVQYRPEWVAARNEDFSTPQFRENSIDNPERMGTQPYRRYHIGQSFAKLRFGPISAGWSNENIWWGPGTKNALLLSNNAPGFSHGTLHTNRPLKTPLGTLEGQMVFGNLQFSGFYPYGINPVVNIGSSAQLTPLLKPDSLRGTGTHSYMNAMQLVWQPRWLSGLFLGVNRGIQVRGYPDGFSDYLNILYIDALGAATTESERNKLNRNQIVSLNMRYLFRQANAEFYAEFARDDHWYDMEDLITRPLATSAWLGGFRKFYQMPGRRARMQVFAEATVIQAPMDNYMQPDLTTVSFYQHANGVGWTHRGEVLGAGIGPGSNMTTLGMEYTRGRSGLGLQWERVVYNEDMYYTIRSGGPVLPGFPNPWFRDISKHFVDWGVQLNFFHGMDRWMLTGKYNLLRTYNFQYRYAPVGVQGPFRFPGINVWSHNAEFSFCYRF